MSDPPNAAKTLRSAGFAKTSDIAFLDERSSSRTRLTQAPLAASVVIEVRPIRATHGDGASRTAVTSADVRRVAALGSRSQVTCEWRALRSVRRGEARRRS